MLNFYDYLRRTIYIRQIINVSIIKFNDLISIKFYHDYDPKNNDPNNMICNLS